jgi:hypothetical protein
VALNHGLRHMGKAANVRTNKSIDKVKLFARKPRTYVAPVIAEPEYPSNEKNIQVNEVLKSKW